MSRTRWSITATCARCAKRYRQVGCVLIKDNVGATRRDTILTVTSDPDDAYHKGENSLVLFVSPLSELFGSAS